MKYYKFSSSKYAYYQVILSSNGVQIKKTPPLFSFQKNHKIHYILDHEMRNAGDETWGTKLVTFRTEE